MTPVDALNTDPALERTPIGAVRAVRWPDGSIVVVARRPWDRTERVIHHLEPGEGVWSALYGKAPLEAESFARNKREAESRRAYDAAVSRQNESNAFHADVRRLFRRHPDLLRQIQAERRRMAGVH